MSTGASPAPVAGALGRLARAWPSLLLWWFARALVAALPALALGRAAGRTLGHHEGGERALFYGGGELLLEALGTTSIEIESLGLVALGALVLASPVLVVAPGAVVLQAASPGLGLGRALMGALARSGSLLLLWVTALFCQALAYTLGAMAFGGATKALVSDTPRGAAVFFGLAVLAIAPAWVLGVVYQLARVEVALGAGLFEAAQRGLERLRRSRARIFASALATSLGVVVCAFAGVALLELVWRGPWQATLGTVLIELTALAALLARAGFVVVALGLRPADSESDVDAPGGLGLAPGGVDASDLSTPLQGDTGLE